MVIRGGQALLQLQPHPASEPKPLGDRRAAARIVTICRLVKIRSGRSEGIARCRNISDGGVKFETHMPIRVHERVTIGFSPHVEINGTCIWVDGVEGGVSFDAPVDCIAVLRKTARSDPTARPPRLQTALPARVWFPGGKCGALVSDISLQGMKVSHDGHLHPGLNVSVMLADGLDRRALVAWSREDCAGLQLLDRFRLDELPPLLATVA